MAKLSAEKRCWFNVMGIFAMRHFVDRKITPARGFHRAFETVQRRNFIFETVMT